MELGIRVPEAFHSLSFISVQFPLDYIDQLKALFISKSYHIIICTSIRGKHNAWRLERSTWERWGKT